MRQAVDEAMADGHQQDQRKLGRLRVEIILHAHMQGWPAINLGTVTVAMGYRRRPVNVSFQAPRS